MRFCGDYGGVNNTRHEESNLWSNSLPPEMFILALIIFMELQITLESLFFLNIFFDGKKYLFYVG